MKIQTSKTKKVIACTYAPEENEKDRSTCKKDQLAWIKATVIKTTFMPKDLTQKYKL